MPQIGKFIDFYLPYRNQNGNRTPVQQAEEILQTGLDYKQTYQKNIGILYSANYGQTRKIQQVYLSNGWDTGTDGSNQASVMHAMESLLHQPKYQILQNAIRILPITTMNAYTHPVTPWNEDILLGIIQTDLDRIRAYLSSGWIVLGWQNQNTLNTDSPYAVGGGVSRIPSHISIHIQTTLKQFAAQFT